VLTHFLSVQSHADGASDMSVYIVCMEKLFKEFERRFKDSECTKFTVSCINNPFQERDASESVFKVNVSATT
jgi:hypothetical protein